MGVFSVDDLFTIGIGFDLVGAYLLGKGLLVSPAMIRRRSGSYWDENPHELLSQAEDRVDAIAGLGGLVAGFTLQAAGYVFVLARDQAPGHGWGRAVIALLLAVVAAAAWRAGWAVARPRALKRLLVELAYLTPAGERHEKPSGAVLMRLGTLAGWAAAAPEVTPGGAAVYARRVFGVDADAGGE